MKHKLETIAKRAAQNPAVQQSIASLKPSLSIWGVFGVILFFIVPEIIGFIWGVKIATWAHD